MPSSDDEGSVEVLTDQQFSDDYDWDIDSARGTHETLEQWTLRRTFLERNKHQIPKLRLQCLSQVFVNMEFLGCKYPAETMAEVASLSEGLLEEFRDAEKKAGTGAAQRTMVTASSAAQKKYNKGAAVQFVRPEPPKVVEMEIETDDFDQIRPESPPAVDMGEFRTIPSMLLCSGDCFAGLVLIEFLYLEESPLALLKKSCEMCRVPHKFPKPEQIDASSGLVCKYKAEFSLGNPVNPFFYSELISPDKDTVKSQLAIRVIRLLKEHVYTVQIKEIATSDTEIDRNTIEQKQETVAGGADQATNVGARLMRLMGWTGGGLGKSESGVTEPIDVSSLVGRSRLGLGSSDKFLKFQVVKQFLEREFRNSESTKELVFYKEFTADEREVMHKVARQLNLKSRSYGAGPDRHLVISKKVIFRNLVEELINSYNGETPKYRLVKPLRSP